MVSSGRLAALRVPWTMCLAALLAAGWVTARAEGAQEGAQQGGQQQETTQQEATTRQGGTLPQEKGTEQKGATQQEPGTQRDKSAGAAVARGKKLILKDGSDLLVSSYELQGERVRYYSTERSDWEEIPAANVDWEATHKAEADAAREQQARLEKIRASDAARKAESIQVDASVEVAPGVFLPPSPGVFYVEGSTLMALKQAVAEEKVDKRRLLEQVMTPIPLVPSRHNIVLKGAQADLRISSRQPEFYIRTPDGHEPEMELIQAKVKKGGRVIENLDTLFKEQNAVRTTVPLQSWEMARGLFRLTLGTPLGPGEYALAEIVAGQGMNFFVWDFGVDAGVVKRPSQ
jgi:hypothetical protein